ncbi:MAG: hypothetical protein WCZ66_05840 [Sphingomonadaceae bacterium]
MGKIVSTIGAGALLLFMADSATAAPPLQAMHGTFRPGLWQVNEVGDGTDKARTICAAAPEQLLTAGRPARACKSTVIANEPGRGIITYQCKGGLSGRTMLRRDAANIYTIDAQGLDRGRPFALLAEWRRVGDCK